MTGPGRFITFEGGEGAGKSTQIRRLGEHLAGLGLEIALTREPGGSPAAEEIRGLLVEGAPERWQPLTEALLHFAARHEHLTTMIRPALAGGRWVLSDRFADSTIAYQGYGHGLAHSLLEDLYRLTVGDFVPDLTLILDLPVEEGLRRASRRGGAEDRYERMEPGFHQRLRQGFLAIAEANPRRCVVIDANRDVEAVAKSVQDAVVSKFGLSR